MTGKHIRLEFTWAGQKRVVYGLKNKHITHAQAREITNDAKQGQACFALSIQQQDDVVSPIPEEITHLLHQLDEIFQTPTQLPPAREIEHHITLKEGSDPVNVRPY